MTARTRQRAASAHADQAEPDTQSCPHGQRVRKAGFGQKSGKPYAGYFCGDNRRDCAPVWASEQVIADALAAWAASDDAAKPVDPKPAKDADEAASSPEPDEPPF